MQAINQASQGADFSKYFDILKRCWLLSGMVSAVLYGLMLANVLSKPDIYQVTGQPRFTPNDDLPKIDGIQGLNPVVLFRDMRLIATQFRLMLFQKLLTLMPKRLPQSAEADRSINVGLQKDFKILPIHYVDNVQLFYESVKPYSSHAAGELAFARLRQHQLLV